MDKFGGLKIGTHAIRVFSIKVAIRDAIFIIRVSVSKISLMLLSYADDAEELILVLIL